MSQNLDVQKTAEDTAVELLAIPGCLPHRTRFEGSFDSQHAEGGQNASPGQNGEESKFFRRRWVKAIQMKLNIWASVKKAKLLGASERIQTIESMVGIKGPKLPEESKEAKTQTVTYLVTGQDSELGKWQKDLEIFYQTGTYRLDAHPEQIFLEIDLLLARLAPRYIPTMLVIYPLGGKFQTDPQILKKRTNDEIAADELVEKTVIKLLGNANVDRPDPGTHDHYANARRKP